MAKLNDEAIERLRVPSRGKFRLSRVDPDDHGGFLKQETEEVLARDIGALDELQQRLGASAPKAVLVVLQAMDTGGKDGTIRKVFGPLNSLGLDVTSFKVPTPEELSHDYLWRIHKACPARGRIGIFNRSHYEDVVIVRVHEWVDRKTVEKRYDQINEFERTLAENGTVILKFFLHISRDEQRRRLQERLEDATKHWKFNPGDLEERKLWNDYMDAYGKALTHCSTPWAPWYVIPANHKWYRNMLVGRVVRRALERMKLEFPPPAPGLDKIRVPK